MRKWLIVLALSLVMIGGASAQSEYQYDITHKFFEPSATIQDLDSKGDLVAAITYEPSSALDDSIFFYKDGDLQWSAQHRTVGTPSGISVNRNGVLTTYDSGEFGVLPAKGNPVPDEPIIFDSNADTGIDVAQSDNILFTAYNVNSLDDSNLQLYDSDTVYREGNESVASGAIVSLDSATEASFQEIEYDSGKLYATTQKAGQQESQLRIYTVQNYNDIDTTSTRIVNFTDLAIDLEVYNGEASVLLDNGEIKTYNSKGKEQSTISFQNSANADDIGKNEKNIVVYGTSIMYAVNPDTGSVDELFDIDRSLKPVNADDWLKANQNSMTYTPEQNIFQEEGSFGAGGLQGVAEFIFEDIGGFSQENSNYAAAFALILITTGFMGLMAGRIGALLGGVLGVTIASVTNLLPLAIVYIMAVVLTLVLLGKLSGGGDNGGGGM